MKQRDEAERGMGGIREKKKLRTYRHWLRSQEEKERALPRAEVPGAKTKKSKKGGLWASEASALTPVDKKEPPQKRGKKNKGS